MPPVIQSALLLTAGLGIRLAPLTSVRAKPAVPVAGEALVRRITRWLAASGVSDLVLNLHHLPGTITAVMGEGSDLGVRVRYSWEQPLVLGTAGGPRQAAPLLDNRTFLIVNGDTHAEVDLAALAAHHVQSKALVTLALTPNREPLRYGGLRLDPAGSVSGAVPRGPAAATAFHFVGVQIADAEAFSGLEAGRPANSIGGVYDEWLARRPGSITGFVSDIPFLDIGTPENYWNTSLAVIAQQGGRGWHGERLTIDPTARVDRSIVWDDVEIGAGVTLEECIVTDRVRVPAGSAFFRSILHHDSSGRLIATPFQTGVRR